MKSKTGIGIALLLVFVSACATYKAAPLPFRAPSSYPNAVTVGGATIGAEAFADPKKAEEAFGYNVRGAGMLPVEIVFDNQGTHQFSINPSQCFLEDEKGNLWPILSDKMAYDRATKYTQTKEIFKGGAYAGFLGAAAGAVVGAAIGIVTGQGVGEYAGKGALIGGAAGAVGGGAQGFADAPDARQSVVSDLNQKSLQNRPILRGLSFGFLFFPGESPSAKRLRIQIVEEDTGKVYDLNMPL